MPVPPDIKRFIQLDGNNPYSNLPSSYSGLSNGSTSAVGSFTTSQIIDGLCEGPIEGWPTSDIYKHIYFDGTPAKSYDGKILRDRLRAEFRPGSADQAPLSDYSLIGAVKAPNFQGELIDVALAEGNPVIQQVQIRDDSDGAYPAVEAISFTFVYPEGLFRYKNSGGRDSTATGIRIEVNRKATPANPDTGWETYVEDAYEAEITSGNFEVTYFITLPAGWVVPKNLQEYTNKVDDVIRFRISNFNTDLDDGRPNDKAHSKVYLKSFATYTRNQFSFPYTALIGTTIDSENFDGSIPRRQYDLKLLKVKVPDNYYITVDEDTGEVVERRYKGIWNGNFKTAWTDNPAWCFYDLITNERYGLGKYIDPSLLNKWKLYEIAKYCDAVVPVTVGSETHYVYNNLGDPDVGGVFASAGDPSIKEPRFTCNVLISSREEAYSLVQKFASLFRGIVFFQQGALQIIQDRPSTPLFIYNNTNIVDGVFTYQSSSIKARHTVAIVKWLDPDDLYSEKLEYVEDYDGIARYGYREIEIDGFGCTSRGQARRIGRHILITEKFELETVSFKVGMEGAIATPGALIKIKDSNRQQERMGGRIVSATSNTITVDKGITVPVGASNIRLWVQTGVSRLETLDSGTSPTYTPTVYSDLIIVNPSGGATTLQLSSGTFSSIPIKGDLWILSYVPSGTTENTTTYKILSVSENNSYEYEITALQHYSGKYDEIEAYAPIPAYQTNSLKLYTPPPTEGSIRSEFNGSSYDLYVSWRSDNYISGTRYKIEMLSSWVTRQLEGKFTDTSYVYRNAQPGAYYFKIYTLSANLKEQSEPLILGPHIIKESMVNNTFSAFSPVSFGSDYIGLSWPEDALAKGNIKYELWRSSPGSLRTFVSSHNISQIAYTTKKVTLGNFDRNTLTGQNYLEVPILPYQAYLTGSNDSITTTSSQIILNTLEKPNINNGDKVYNTTRDIISNVVSRTFTSSFGRWITTIDITPPITSQAAVEIIYIYKGVLGSSFKSNVASGVFKQKTIVAQANTSNSVIYSNAEFTNVVANDVIINRTKKKSGKVSTVQSSSQITLSSSVEASPSDIIGFYKSSYLEARRLDKYSITNVITAAAQTREKLSISKYTGKGINTNSLIANITRGKTAHVLDASIQNKKLTIISAPPMTSQIGDEVVFFDLDEVYTSNINTYSVPSSAVTSPATSPTFVTATGFFTSAQVGDILTNATRNKSSVIKSKTNDAATLQKRIDYQASGDIIFLTRVSSFSERDEYYHPTILTTTTGTTNSTVNITTPGFSGITTSYRFYNMTKNTVATISAVTDSDTISISPAITGQGVGDKCYVFLPTTVSPTVVTAPDGAFSSVAPGDIFHNVTLDKYSTISDITTLTGPVDKRIDRLILSNPIVGQSAGQSFKLLKGFHTIPVIGSEDSGTNDKVELESVVGLSIGDRASIYRMEASRLGTINGTSFVDTGLNPSTSYSYYMRAVSNRQPYIGGDWKPSAVSPRVVTTVPTTDSGNYNTSNDNLATPISPNSVTPVFPYMDLPAGGVNKSGNSNIRMYWEWTGLPWQLDGFVIYFWSSNGSSDDLTIDSDDDYTRETSTWKIRTNPGVSITNLSYVGNTISVSTKEKHGLSNGVKVKILYVKQSGGTLMNVNTNTSPQDFATVTVTSPRGFNYTKTGPTGTHQLNSGYVISCLYTHQIDDVASDYYYNAWIQPYRQVNTNISENGIIVGTPKKLFSSP